ncbi:MAG: 50S ribosomal protein L11 methyltransferase [Bacteroidales bacterium]|jgi:ribosomal protein L11 methyltransferase|nr:50S ribosomal protein L11 methyltransferase [Bacteroidales bacterium]
MDYIEVSVEILPFSEESAELVIAVTDDLPFESYSIEPPYLKAYIPYNKYSPQDLKTILSAFNNSDSFKISVTASLIESCNWNALWESNFTPVTIGERCTVRASFHKGLPKSEYTLVIDPKMAFGTGHHQTTHLMIQAMLDINFKDKRVLDMGCGTGVLAILAAKMGAALPVHAIDTDPVAVESARENSEKNSSAADVVALCGDASLIQASRYEVILANINRNIILSDIGTYSRGLSPLGKLLLSGFYTEDIPLIEREALKFNLKIASQLSREGWCALLLEKS